MSDLAEVAQLTSEENEVVYHMRRKLMNGRNYTKVIEKTDQDAFLLTLPD